MALLASVCVSAQALAASPSLAMYQPKPTCSSNIGSPYAVQDYYSVNSEFGSLDDLKHFVAAAHALGLHAILDWVANHTAWDNVLVTQHREWYARNRKGDFSPTPWWDWDDIIDLDYSKPALRQYMTEAMLYWVKTAGRGRLPLRRCELCAARFLE